MVLLLAGPQKADRHDPSNMILSGHDSVFSDSVVALPRNGHRASAVSWLSRLGCGLAALGLSVFELMLS
jgi:hypothetical protein